jgi:hypothetical protein
MKYKNMVNKILVVAFLFCVSNNVFSQLTPLTVGTISPGDSIVIYYDVTINTGCGCTQISNQGSVSGANFSTLNTDDPDTGPGGDPTITLLNLFPLPITLYEIRAAKKTGGIEVSWKVAAESNMVKYEVERSTDGRNFTKIGEVASQNSSPAITYSYLDVNPNNGINFYRLRLIDLDGSRKYSPIVRVDISGTNSGISIYPNPVREKQIAVQLNNLSGGTYQLAFYNTMGQIVFLQSITHDGGSVSKYITLPSGLSSGVYSVKIKKGSTLFSQLMVIQ